MARVNVEIGKRPFDVACEPGQEGFLKAAAALLDAEATELSAQIGRLPEQRMLLMAGLMLADKMATLRFNLRKPKKNLPNWRKIKPEMTRGVWMPKACLFSIGLLSAAKNWPHSDAEWMIQV